jgi:hypothetical protein
MSPTLPLKPATRYRVKIKGQARAFVRIFKWSEKRRTFGMKCFVFTAPVAADVVATWNAAKESLTLSGKRVPRSEVSVPHYDLLSCEPV